MCHALQIGQANAAALTTPFDAGSTGGITSHDVSLPRVRDAPATHLADWCLPD